MSKSLFIAEKPSVAQEFAKALKVGGVRKDGYLEGDEVIVTWCVGHLVTMSYPEAYDPKYKRWSLAMNFLILDEPTNHLDITSKEILEEALNNYSGTVLYVSHDRYFINQTASRILELVNCTFVNYIGNYDYYLEKKEELTRAYASSSPQSASETAQSSPAPQASESKLSWQEQKEQQAKERKRKNDLKKAEDEISRLEDRNAAIDHEMTLEEVYSNSVRCQELTTERAENEARLEELYELWETLAE